jgi:hypothetical protein
MLAIITEHVKVDGKIKGVVPNLVDDGLSILQYANDMILFVEHDFEKGRNLKLILSAFQKLPRVLKLTSIKVNCFDSARLGKKQLCMLTFLAAGLVNFLFT